MHTSFLPSLMRLKECLGPGPWIWMRTWLPACGHPCLPRCQTVRRWTHNSSGILGITRAARVGWRRKRQRTGAAESRQRAPASDKIQGGQPRPTLAGAELLPPSCGSRLLGAGHLGTGWLQDHLSLLLAVNTSLPTESPYPQSEHDLGGEAVLFNWFHKLLATFVE